MRWERGRRSKNVIDRRGSSPRRRRGRTMGSGLGMVVLVLVALYFGVDPRMVMDMVVITGVAMRAHMAAPVPMAMQATGMKQRSMRRM